MLRLPELTDRGRGPGMQGEPWKVAGVVSFPGWHWLTKTSGMRVRRGGFVAPGDCR